MAKLLHNGWLVSLLFMLTISLSFAQKTPEITLEKVTEKCKGLPQDKWVVVEVAHFNVSIKSVMAFGREDFTDGSDPQATA